MIAAELPGAKEDAIEIEVRGDVLALSSSGERRYAKEVLLPSPVDAGIAAAVLQKRPAGIATEEGLVMSNAIKQKSRTRVEDTTLQVIADTQRNLDCLIREEELVIRRYVLPGQMAAQIGQHVRVRGFAAACFANQKCRRAVLGRRRGRRPPAHGQHLRCGRSDGMHNLCEPACARGGGRLG